MDYPYGIDTTQYIGMMVKSVERKGLKIDLANPKTIQEKLCWLNIYDCNVLKVCCADKLELHNYCRETLGKDLCVPVIKVYDNPDNIDFDTLPERFVLKCNHGSGMNIIVDEKSKLDKKYAVNCLKVWLNDNFAFRNGFEAHYNSIPRKCYAEEYLDDGTGDLKDYKFWCFNGEPKIWTINGGAGHGDIMYYRMDGSEWDLYEVGSNPEYKKPATFDEMVEYAKALSNPFKFVRVDFYEIGKNIVLGEMTFTPGAMRFKYKKDDDNLKVGDLLNIKQDDK